MKMIVNSYNEVDELAKEAVLYAMKNENHPDMMFSKLNTGSILYKIYDDLCRTHGILIGSYFAIHLKEKYQIEIPIT